MADQFNPYREWLGIETDGPPDHYELLRIAALESQPQVISAAAAAQMAKIRGIRPGARVADWQRILDELAAAKSCLCDPAAKSLYDEEKKRALKSRRNLSGAGRSDIIDASASRSDSGSAGKNLLPPSKSAPPKRIEESPASEEPIPAGPSLNPLPPTKGASPATAIAATSSSSTLPGRRAAQNKPLEARATSVPPTTPAPWPGGPAPSMPAGGAAPYGVPTAPTVGVPMHGVPLPTAALPGTGFPAGPAASAPNSGSPLPAGGMSAGGFPTTGAPSAPVYPQPMPTAAWPWPVGHVMPAGSPVGMSHGNAAPFLPGAAVPASIPRAIPLDSTPVNNTPTAGQPFLDDLLREGPSPLDELGLAASTPVGIDERAQAPRMPDDTGSPSRARLRGASLTPRNSSHAAIIAGGIALAALAIVAVVIVMTNKQRNANAVADLASNNAKSQPINPAPKAPPSSSPSPQKVADVHKTNPAPNDVNPHAPPPDQQKDPVAGSHNELLPDTLAPPDNPSASEHSSAKQHVPDVPKPMPESSKPAPDAPKPMPSDPAVTAKIQKLLAAARAKLGERNQEAAKKLVAEAGELAVSDEQHDMVDRVDSLEKYVGEFWSAVYDSVKGLKAADEIDLGSTKVIVVEASAEALTIHVSGQNRRYQVNQLPSGLAVGLALRWLDAKKPENKVFVGAFYLVDPKTGPEQAKQAWDEATAAGVDVKNLLPLLQPD